MDKYINSSLTQCQLLLLKNVNRIIVFYFENKDKFVSKSETVTTWGHGGSDDSKEDPAPNKGMKTIRLMKFARQHDNAIFEVDFNMIILIFIISDAFNQFFYCFYSSLFRHNTIATIPKWRILKCFVFHLYFVEYIITGTIVRNGCWLE